MSGKEIQNYVVPGIVGLVLMAGLGALFRVLIGHAAGSAEETETPAVAETSETVTAAAVPARLDPPEACLARPLSDWTAAECEAYPEVRAWLERQSRRVLPWEWSNEALAKDPAGYCRLWRDLWWELEARLLVSAVGRLWGTSNAVSSLAGDADLLAVADLRRASENLARRCDGDGVPTVGELRGHEAEALGNLARVIVLSAW